MGNGIQLAAALLCNLAIALIETILMIKSGIRDREKLFLYYTNDSNIFCGISSIIFIIAAIPVLAGRASTIPAWVMMLRYMGTLGVALTFVIVITALAPAQGKGGYTRMLFKGHIFYVHLLCPVLSTVSFIFFEDASSLKPSSVFIVMIPTLIYAAVAITQNIRNVWDGPYFFLKVHKQPVLRSILWFIAVIGGAFLIGVLLRYLNGTVR